MPKHVSDSAMSKPSFGIIFYLPKSQTRNCCRNPKLLPKAETNAESRNYCRKLKLMPKAETNAEIQNYCQNLKPIPKPETSNEIQNWSNLKSLKFNIVKSQKSKHTIMK